ncbi:MAG: hypothetical protein AAGJ81_10700 [Verrucomicrobiota bacterium]
MNISPLPPADRTALGATHLISIDHEDLTETTNNTAQTVTLAVVDGSLFQLVAMRLVIPFQDADDAAFNSTTLTIGDGDDADRYLAATQLNVNGTEIDYAAGLSVGYAYNAADTVDFAFGSMSGKALADIDTGEVALYVRVADLNHFGPHQ